MKIVTDFVNKPTFIELHRTKRKMRQISYKKIKLLKSLFGDVKAPYPFSVKENLGLVSHFKAFVGWRLLSLLYSLLYFSSLSLVSI